MGIWVKMESYRELKVWQLGMELAKEVYRITRIFPKEEMYGLTSQMRRASVSVPANIAEGWARTRKEYMRFLLIARGSLMELETYLLLCNDLDYLKEEASKDFLEKCSQIGKMLNSLYASLRKHS